MAPSAIISVSSISSTTEQAQLWVGLLAAPLWLPASSSSSSSPALRPSAVASAAVEAVATVVAASAASFARATSSRPDVVEESTGAVAGDAEAAADGTVPAAAVTDAEPPIGGAESSGVALMMGELEAQDAMEHGERNSGSGDVIWRRS